MRSAMRNAMRDAMWSSLLAALVLTIVAPPRAIGAQGGTDVWVAPLSEIGSRLSVGRPVNVTNRAGYDNQPAFTRDGSQVLFTSVRDDAQADIWRVSVTGGAHTRVTTTTESEYSATPIPGGEGISVIRVERDSTQRLWRFADDGGSPSLVLHALRPVGYHVWIGPATLGTFVLGGPLNMANSPPNALVLVDARTERADTLARGIGRALARVPGRDAFTFVQEEADTNWISEVDVRTGAVRRLVAAPPRADYHVWTVGGQLITAVGSRLLVRVEGRWDVLADFAPLGVKGISRLALSPAGDRIAFVAADVNSP